MPDAPARREAQRGRPHPGLRGAVLSYTGYSEWAAGPMRRLEVPTAVIPVIISFGPSLVVDGVLHRSFAAGIGDAPTVTEYSGDQLGIQIDLAPLGARRVLGLPMVELTRRVVPLDAILGTAFTRLVDELANASDWTERFGLLDAVLLARLASSAAPAPELDLAWARLASSGGGVSVSELARETGWSRRHLTSRFTSEIGLGPKAVGRIMRFERVTSRLHARRGTGLAEIAYDCGYADQAHLNRDFRAFAGTTPTAFAARLLANDAGVSADDFPNVQDGRVPAG